MTNQDLMTFLTFGGWISAVFWFCISLANKAEANGWKKIAKGWEENYENASDNTIRAMAMLVQHNLITPEKYDAYVKARADRKPGPSDPDQDGPHAQ